MQNLLLAAQKNHPLDVSETLFPEQTPDGRHLTNTSLDQIHMTKRAQVLKQVAGTSMTLSSAKSQATLANKFNNLHSGYNTTLAAGRTQTTVGTLMGNSSSIHADDMLAQNNVGEGRDKLKTAAEL